MAKQYRSPRWVHLGSPRLTGHVISSKIFRAASYPEPAITFLADLSGSLTPREMAEYESHRTSRADAAQARIRRQQDSKGATVEVAVSGRRPRSGVPPRRSPLFLCWRRPGLPSTKSAQHTASHRGLIKDDQPSAPNTLGISEGRALQVASLPPSSLNPMESKELGLRL